MSELDTFLNSCANGELAGNPLMSHVREMCAELLARRKRDKYHDTQYVVNKFLLGRVARLECKMMVVERLLGDLGDVAKSASNR